MRSCVWMCAESYQCFCNAALPLHCLMQRSLGASPPFDLAFRALLDSFWHGSCSPALESRALRCALCAMALHALGFGLVGLGLVRAPFPGRGMYLGMGLCHLVCKVQLEGSLKQGSWLLSLTRLPAVAFCPLLRGVCPLLLACSLNPLS